MSNSDPGDIDFIIDGQIVSEFTGGDFNTAQGASPNEGPGGVRFGFNFQRSANGCDISFSVRDTSLDMGRLWRLARDQKEVTIEAVVARHLDQYDDGEIIGFYCPRAVITVDSVMEGRGEAEDVSFSATGIGWELRIKGDADVPQPHDEDDDIL